jgi:Domain of unknown function (DUF4272)
MSDLRPRIPERVDVRVDEDEIDVELRTPAEARARILILAAVLRRLALEEAFLDAAGELLGEAFDERAWLQDQGLAGDLTPRESVLLDSPVGSSTPEEIAHFSWQGEAMVALAWAVGVADRPPVDATSDPLPVMDLVPRPWDTIQRWMSDPAIVSESDAVRERELAEIWHWRATTELLLREASAADRREYEAAIREVAAEALDAGIVPALREGDFLVRGRSMKDLTDGEVDELVAVTGQRLRALNWLCGFGDSWDDVPLDL